MRSSFHRVVPILLLAAACGGDSGGSSGPPEIVEIIKWTPSGDNQTDTSGQTLPLVLRVKVTVDDAVSAGHVVTFAGPGTFGTPVVTTGANGIATTTWTLPTEAGTTQATVTLDGAVGSPLTFTATGVAGPATDMILVAGDNQATTRLDIFNSAFTLQVTDQYGNGKEGVMVHWSVTGPADLLVDSSPSLELGFANAYLTAHAQVGAVVLTGEVEGLDGSPIVFHANVVNESVNVLVKNNFFDPAALTIDAGTAVRWQLVGTGHTITPTGGGVIPGSPVLATGNLWGPVLFADPGVYTYECSEHAAMAGTITVNP